MGQMWKTHHDKRYQLRHEGQLWVLDLAVWYDKETQKGELRVYRVEGNVTTPLLIEALQLEAAARGLKLSVATELNNVRG